MFRHEALFYAGQEEFVDRTSAFITDAIAADEPVLVVVAREKLELLRWKLGDDARRVAFADMEEVGHNPARIIPAWHDFAADNAHASRFRGIGEPISASRCPEALVECQRHEDLLNAAFDEGPEWWLLCPYDTTTLPTTVLDEAARSHPWVFEDGTHRASDLFDGPDTIRPFDIAFPPPPDRADVVAFGQGQLDEVRRRVESHGVGNGLSDERIADLTIAVSELITNSVIHGGGYGVLRIWSESDDLICEVRDLGLNEKPLAGRKRPTPQQESGFGLWVVYHLCDLVEIRSFDTGSIVRLHMTRR